jgi:hypothetical protein
MSGVQPSTKCPACNRVTATHAAGCSLVACPNRRPEVGMPPNLVGSLAEERIIVRLAQRHLAAPVELEEL